jgi:2-hydroxychromene-2-carboxylate isomerase
MDNSGKVGSIELRALARALINRIGISTESFSKSVVKVTGIMTVNIEVFYSFQSPYSYLAIEGIYQLEKDFDIEILWQPFSAKAAGQQVPPSPIIPDKLSYLIEDCTRFANEHNIPLQLPERWTEEEFEPGRATRGAIVANDLDVLMEYNYKVFHKWWGEGQDPNDENFMAELCDELDVDLGEFLSKLSNSDTRERVKGVYRRGRKLGVFDTPTIMIDKERFVGLDKLHAVRERLEKMGLKR